MNKSRNTASLISADERGQATAEYALVLLGASSVALLLLNWAGGTGAIGSLLDFVVDHIRSSVG